MKRFIIRQFAFVLALVMLLTLTGVAEELPPEGLDLQDIGIAGLELEDIAPDGTLELELEAGGSDGLILSTDDEAAGQTSPEDTALEGTLDVVVDELATAEGPTEDMLIDDGSVAQGSGGDTWQARYDMSGALSDNDALADAYLRSVLPGLEGRTRKNTSPSAGRQGLVKMGLTGSVAVYDAVKPMIEAVASGQRTSTEFTLDSAAMGIANNWWTAAELGVPGLDASDLGDRLLAKENINSWAIMTALMEDCPYHLYWFDKTASWYLNGQNSIQGDKAQLASVTLSLPVAADYAGASPYTVNALPGKVSAAVANINKTVDSSKSLDDLEKLTAYADAICGYVEYNHSAADENNNTPYGDPWQLVWIFDGDPNTKVVCEGYSKGFKYLCDLSAFKGEVGCVLAEGMMYGGTGEGPHMWNSLKMPDGKCYLVDLTNCDAGDKCDYSLFLKGASGEAGGPYVCRGLRYEFYDWMISKFGADSPWLTYSNADYGKDGTGGGDSTANQDWAAFQAEINAAADGATVTLTKDLTASGGNVGLVIPAGKTLTLDLAGHMLNRGLTAEKVDGHVLGVQGNLTLKDSVGGGKITGGWTAEYGGGIYVAEGARLTVAGGEISGNRAYKGGGVGTRNAQIAISGGRLSNNNAIEQGGGVEIGSGRLEITGGEITGNRSRIGGGINVWIGGTFEMKGGRITNNDAYDPNADIHLECGGGVCGYNANITMTGGEISGNRANLTGGDGKVFHPQENFNYMTKGGGLFIQYGTFSMTGGTIKGNTSTCGGGVTAEDADFVLTGGDIKGNTGCMGGGIYVHACQDTDTASFTMKGGEISDNFAENYGGGIVAAGSNNAKNARLQVTGGRIKGNHTVTGGGIFSIGGLVEISGGYITDNTVRSLGGGVYIQRSTLRMTGGEISNNNTIFDGPYPMGGGVGMPPNQQGPNEVLLSGEPVIANNWVKANGEQAQRNLSLVDEPITIVEPLGEKARIGVERPEGNVFTKHLGAGGNIGAFFSDDPNYTVEWSEDGQEARLVKKEIPSDPTLSPQPTAPATPTPTATPIPSIQPTDPTTPTPTATPIPPTSRISLSKCRITVKDLTYTGKKIKKPSVTIKYGRRKLKEGTDYSLSYDKNAKKIGAYKLTVSGKGEFSGSKKVTFKVIPKGTTFSKLTGGKKQITLKWKSQKNITGYEIEYSLKSSFSGAKKAKVKKPKTLTVTIKALKAKTKYYVRIRTYTAIKKKIYYSAWSGAKSVKTK